MARSTGQNRRLLYLAKIFLTDTDENHPLSVQQLIEKLAVYHIQAERKALYHDFDDLQEIGMDIVRVHEGRSYRYFLGSRNFELPELKILIDCIQASRFLPQEKSAALIQKLQKQASRYEAGRLQRQLLTAGRVKSVTQTVFYSVDTVYEAIAQNCQIRFHYFRWGMNREKLYGHNGDWYVVSPWHLLWDDENYYMIAWDAAEGIRKHFRVDRMETPELLPDRPREGITQMQQTDPSVYTKQLFNMYDGETVPVALNVDAELAGVIFDRFGLETPVIPTDEGHFNTLVEVAVSPQFLGWIAGLGGKIRILGPEQVVAQMRQLLQTLCSCYEPESPQDSPAE